MSGNPSEQLSPNLPGNYLNRQEYCSNLSFRMLHVPRYTSPLSITHYYSERTTEYLMSIVLSLEICVHVLIVQKAHCFNHIFIQSDETARKSDASELSFRRFVTSNSSCRSLLTSTTPSDVGGSFDGAC